MSIFGGIISEMTGTVTCFLSGHDFIRKPNGDLVCRHCGVKR